MRVVELCRRQESIEDHSFETAARRGGRDEQKDNIAEHYGREELLLTNYFTVEDIVLN